MWSIPRSNRETAMLTIGQISIVHGTSHVLEMPLIGAKWKCMGTAVEPGVALSGVQCDIDWLGPSVAGQKQWQRELLWTPWPRQWGPPLGGNHKKGNLSYFGSPVTEWIFPYQVYCEVNNSEALGHHWRQLCMQVLDTQWLPICPWVSKAGV